MWSVPIDAYSEKCIFHYYQWECICCKQVLLYHFCQDLLNSTKFIQGKFYWAHLLIAKTHSYCLASNALGVDSNGHLMGPTMFHGDKKTDPSLPVLHHK